MTEKKAWEWLRDGVKGMTGLHLQRVESSVAQGVPDVEGCIRGSAFWMELKAAREPATDTSLVICEPLKERQLQFIERRLKAGGNVWILYRVGRRVYLIHGKDAAQVAPRPRLLHLRHLSWVVPDACPWEILREIGA